MMTHRFLVLGIILLFCIMGVSSLVAQENLPAVVRNNPDLEVPKGKEGVDEVLDRLFSFGTKSLDRMAFQKALDDIGARESAGTDFSLQVLAGHLEHGVELLTENELQPALPEEAFKIVKQQLAAEVVGRLQSPDYLAKRALRAALFSRDDPTLREATPSTISSLTLQDVKDYYQKVFRPDLTTVVVIGKITSDEARRVVGKKCGSWKAAGVKPNTLLPSVPQNRPSITSVPDASRVQDRVILAETLGLNRSNPDFYALELGNHVLGGAFYATRLYKDLREETGLVYYVSSSFDIGQTRALYVVSYACDPLYIPRARAIVEQNLKEMQNTPVTPDELQKAKALLLREIPLSESSVESIAQGLIYRATHGLPLNEPTLAATKYAGLTAEQVKAAFMNWVRPSDLVQVTIGPTSK